MKPYPLLAEYVERSDCSPEQMAHAITLAMEDHGVRTEDGESVVITGKKLRGQTTKAGERCFEKLNGMEVPGKTKSYRKMLGLTNENQ